MLRCVSLLSHVWLFVNTLTVACQVPLSMEILQARILEWVAMPSSRSSQPRNWTHVASNAGKFFTSWATNGQIRLKVNIGDISSFPHFLAQIGFLYVIKKKQILKNSKGGPCPQMVNRFISNKNIYSFFMINSLLMTIGSERWQK